MDAMQKVEVEDGGGGALCFQRTPSLRRKWRKRYGGLDGNKLLEPDTHILDSEQLTDESKQAAAAKETVPRPAPRSPAQTLVQKPVGLVSGGTAGTAGASAANGGMTPPFHQAAVQLEDRGSAQSWFPPQQCPSRRRVAADVLFDSFASEGRISINVFFEAIWSSGLQRSDSRLRECFFQLRKLQDGDGSVDRTTFHRCVSGFVSLILKALQGRLAVPDFCTFSEETQKLFSKCRQLTPAQDEGTDRKWGVSICTVDGQRLSLGDCSGPRLLGEASWPLLWAAAVELLGAELVHRYVGVDDYSRYPSPFAVTGTGIPHSPLTEAGAIITASLLQLARQPCGEEEDAYDSVLNVIRRLSNKEHAHLNCSSHHSSQQSSAHLHALSFYLQQRKCPPEKVDVGVAVDLLLQCSSTEVTCESGAVMAASLANGGLCPLSGDQVVSAATVRNVLSVMQAAGMKDYSATFRYQTSVPAASGSHGALLAVVPGVLGLMAFSPELDTCGNPRRAVLFCQELISRFQLHSFDIRTPFRQVLAYRQWKVESEGYQIMNVLLAAFRGDVPALRRYFLSGVDVNAVDYDGRSALHVAAAEGHTEVIRFLLENAKANPALRDRWGSSALQEAKRSDRDAAVRLLQGAM